MAFLLALLLTVPVFGLAEPANGEPGNSEPENVETENGEPESSEPETDQAAIEENIRLQKALATYYAGKKVSIIGDSIDTFDQEGYRVDGYAMLYPIEETGVVHVNHMWWMRIINATGARLEVNASCSGSRVTRTVGELPDLYSRTFIIGNPDLVFVSLGTNDSLAGIPLGVFDFETDYRELPVHLFRQAYIKGIKSLKAMFPKAEIVCITKMMEPAYKESIAYIANALSVTYIDVSDYVGQLGVHPGMRGMRQIASHVMYHIYKSLLRNGILSGED